MKSFNSEYASIYDELYAEKDYQGEVDYLESIWAHHDVDPDRVLDLGCGTCEHALELANRGYTVTGVDRSGPMIEEGREKITKAGFDDRISVRKMDLTAIDFDNQFDTAVAMFSVIGYISNQVDLVNAFNRIRDALKPGGIFIFDAWYGPAVLEQRPDTRLRRIKKTSSEILRFASPEIDVRNQIVNVEYIVLEISDDGSVISQQSENHEVRFFFENEMEALTTLAEIEISQVHSFLEQSKPPSTSTWNVTWVLSKDEEPNL